MARLTLVTLLFASPAFAATSLLPDLGLPGLALMDPIGTGCIDGGGYDDPFPSSKSVRAPAFCLPDPCKAALSREDLGHDILGRTVENWEWDAYYSRYAEFCRAEAVVPRGGGSTPTAETFWAPIISPGIATYLPGGTGRSPVRSFLNGGGSRSGGSTPIPGIPIGSIPIGGGTSAGGGGSAPGNGGTTPGGGGTTTPDGGGPDIPVVPLPLAGWLLASSLAALAGLSQSRRRLS